MRLILGSLCLVLWLSCLGVRGAEAQWGGLIDKLQKLSGPRLVYDGPIFRIGYQPGQRMRMHDASALRSAVDTFKVLRSSKPEIMRDIDEGSIAMLDTCITRVSEAVEQLTNSGELAFSEARIDQVRVVLNRSHGRLRDLNRTARRAVRTPISAEDFRTLQTAVCRAPDALQAVAIDPLLVDPGRGFVFRFGLFRGYDADNGDRVEDIYSLSLQPTVEYRFRAFRKLNLGVEIGFALHYFHGDLARNFWHLSHPVLLNFHPFARNRSWLLRNIRIGGGVHIFRPFDDDAFAPVLNMADEGWEFVGAGFASLDISLSSLPLPRRR